MIPFDYLDKACLAATFAPWASFAPTWRLLLRQAPSEAALRAAVGALVRRYPLLASKVVALDEKRFAWQPDPSPDLDRLVCSDAGGDRFLDLHRDYPFAASLSGNALILQQHHALADGRAFVELCGDLVALLAGQSLPPEPVPRRPEREVHPERGLAAAWAFARGAAHAIAELVRASVFPSTPLLSNRGEDYTGSNRTHFLLVPADLLETWREGRKRLGLSTNDLLAAALALALSRWSAPAGRTRLLMPVDVRPREGFHSFANHLSSIQVTLDLSGKPGLLQLAKQISAHAAAVNSAQLPRRKLRFEAWLVKRMRLDALRRQLFVKRRLLTSWSFSNLIGLEPSGGGWSNVEGLRITTPCTPPQGANTTVVRYRGQLCFNFNYKDSVLGAEQVAGLAATFEEALCEVSGSLASPGTR